VAVDLEREALRVLESLARCARARVSLQNFDAPVLVNPPASPREPPTSRPTWTDAGTTSAFVSTTFTQPKRHRCRDPTLTLRRGAAAG